MPDRLKVYIGYDRTARYLTKKEVVRSIENYIDIMYKMPKGIDVYATKVEFYKTLPFSKEEYRELHLIHYSNKNIAAVNAVLDESKLNSLLYQQISHSTVNKSIDGNAAIRWYVAYIANRQSTTVNDIKFNIPIFDDILIKDVNMYGVESTVSRYSCQIASPVVLYCNKCLSQYSTIAHKHMCEDRSKVIDIMYNDMYRLYDGNDLIELMKVDHKIVKMVPASYHYFISREMRDLIKIWYSNAAIYESISLSEFIKSSIS